MLIYVTLAVQAAELLNKSHNNGKIITHTDLIFSESYLDKPMKPIIASIQTIDAKVIKFKELRGKIIIICFWATWHLPSEEELLSLEAFIDSLEEEREKIEIITISLDFKKPEELRKYYDSLNIKNLPLIIDYDQELRNAFDINFLPGTVILNKQGEIFIRITENLRWNAEEIRNNIIALTWE